MTKQVIVTLDAVQAHAEKSPGNSASQFDFIGRLGLLVLVHRNGKEIDLGLRCPNAMSIDQAAHKLVIGTVLPELLPKPIDHSVTAINQKGAVLDADVGPREPLGNIITVTTI